MPDLALALLTAKTRREVGTSFRKDFEQLLKMCEDLGFVIDESVLIRTYSAIATGTTRFKDARVALDKMSGAEVSQLLKETQGSIEATIKLLQELGIKSDKYLQSRYLVVPTAYLLHHEVLSTGRIISDDLKSGIAKWLILASCGKRYTGRLETELSSDIDRIRDGNGLKGLYGNLDPKEITLSKLESDYENYHLTILLMLYTKTGALDWNEEKLIPEKVSEIDRKQLAIHHIFPEEFLERRNIQQDYDLFGNITILSSEVNNRLKYKNPADYLGKLEKIGHELLEKHCIPQDKELWNVDRYKDFTNERAKLIANKIESEFNIRVLTT
jgi:hypothetical protein